MPDSITKMYHKKDLDRKRRGASLSGFLNSSHKKRYKYTRKKKRTPSSKVTLKDMLYLFVVIICLSCFVIIGPFSLILLLIVVTLLFVGKSTSKSTISPDEITKLQHHLLRIEKCKETVNTSTDEKAVKFALDEILNSIDFIMLYSEQDLNTAGLSKKLLPKQRQHIIDNYHTILDQVSQK